MDLLANALIEISNISKRRLFALCDTTLNYGLSPNLAGKPIGLNYGYGIISPTATAMASQNKILAVPSVVHTIRTKSSQEDHTSMVTCSCRKAQQVLNNLPKIIGVECLLATKATFLTRHALGSFKLGRGSQPLYDALAAVILAHVEAFNRFKSRLKADRIATKWKCSSLLNMACAVIKGRRVHTSFIHGRSCNFQSDRRHPRRNPDR
ncbi:aromatic amino acid lyase [Agrobacterium vitis]|uniref:aromatic amino acid lyase n=1 Tax=Agrobacterium vitis TaxID=373 RepID=UPI001F42FDF7|nr:aromatic amino acid lyase [Agrobacterium vitis]